VGVDYWAKLGLWAKIIGKNYAEVKELKSTQSTISTNWLVAMFAKGDFSGVWEPFVSELVEKCYKVNIEFSGFRDWILDSIVHLEKKDFDYHITIAPNPEEKGQKNQCYHKY
jgi:hypothetical protein